MSCEKKQIDTFLELTKIKDVRRYSEYHHKIYDESVADHCFMMIIMATKFFEELKLDLDFVKVIKLISHHDMCELGLVNDFDAVKVQNNKEYARQKEQTELATITNLSEKYGSEIMELFLEYEKQETREAKFVKALDKIEANIHEMSRGTENFDDPEFIALYPKNAVENFPELIPFLKAFNKIMKKEYRRVGYAWKDEYDIAGKK